ncbi:MAG: hypothetical protein GC160_01830 [Acidobacteria bacterium]|nr:hypothetical protein [Acidobacteriota bacterium]
MRLVLILVSAASLAAVSPAAELRLNVLDESGAEAWARFEVRGPDGKMHQPLGALRDITASNRASGEPWYVGSFVGRGPQVMDLPAGRYLVVVERGPEFERVEEEITLAGEPIEKTIRPARWIDMNELGWYSADFHIHRPLEDVPKLIQAEDLNLGVVFTLWNQRDAFEKSAWPANPVVKVDGRHLYTILNAEDERGGGAWMLHMLRQKIDLKVPGRWYPPGLKFIREAVAQRYVPTGFPWIEVEKPFWLEAPVVMALATPDSIGLLHNHFEQYGMLDNEAWGRARDAKRYPGLQGFVEASLEINYRFWNLGFEVPASAGSASGVLPNPVGYNRLYVEVREPFDVEPFYRNLRQGRSFVTNGPMLFFEATEMPGRRVSLEVDVRSREPLDKVEIVANGVVIETFAAPPGKTRFETEVSLREGLYTWVAARAFTRNESTIRMAHSQPLRLQGFWPTQDDAAFFIRWIDDLIADSQADSSRFANEAQRDEVLEIYRQARQFYADLQ